MFVALSNRTASQIIDAVYYAMRALERRYSASQLPNHRFMRNLDSEPAASDRDVARRILEEIEAREQKTIEELDWLTIEKYISDLARATQQLSEQERKLDPARSQELLLSLRAAVPFPA